MATILVIEDEAPIRDNLCRFLCLEEYAVIEAENGRHRRRLDADEYVTRLFNLPQLAALIRRRLGDPK
jgi:DNA-binding response OmpR family regulator